MYPRLLTVPALVTLTTICCAISLPGTAQIVPDNTLGSENSVVTPNVNIRGINSDRIDGGAVRGGNLFHSFQEFNVDVGRGAYFSNPDSIVNILTRVTGDNISNILGTLGVLGNANLFLINPNGIVFGPNARLDVGGSFFASTADGILFVNGVEFAASNPEAPPLLTINIPLGLNFRENPGTIVNQASATDSSGNITGLEVSPGNSLLLVGGDVNLDGGGLNAPEGRIELGGVSSTGTLGLSIEGSQLSLSFPENVQFSNVTLANDARVSVRGNGGGDIVVNANNFTATNGGRLVVGTEGAGDGGEIFVNADNILISGRGTTAGSGFYNQALPGSSGNLGDIRVNAQTINIIGTGYIDPFSELGFTETGLQNAADSETTGSTGEIVVNTEALNIASGAAIRTATLGAGNADNITITAKNTTLSESGFIESATLEGVGHAGSISVSGETLSLRGGVIGIVTLGEGSVGNLTINASEAVELIGFTPTGSPSSLIVDSSSGQGSAGNLIVNTSKLLVRDGASISTSAGAGSVGDLIINASEYIELSGTSTQQIDDGLPVQIGSRLSALAIDDDNAGNIRITTGNLILRDGAGITADTVRGSSGNAGNITIQASEIEISGEENPGNLDSVSLGSRLRVGTIGSGDAGTITINTGKLILKDGGEISARTLDSGNAGSINIRATDIELIGTSQSNSVASGLFAGVSSGATGNVGDAATGDELTGVGGSISINTERLTIVGGAQINAATFGSGSAGSVTIQAADLQLSGTDTDSGLNRSTITTQTFGTGSGGDITIETERLSLQDGAEITAGTAVPFEFDFDNNEVIIPEDFNPERGLGGTIVIQASESVELSRTSSRFISNVSKISSQVGIGTNGTGGDVIVETGRLTLQDGAEISSSTLGIGDAGSVTIQAEAVELTGTTANGELSSNLSAEVGSEAVGTGGTVSVNTGLLEVRDRANVTVSSEGSGDPGNLQLTASDLRLDTQGSLSAESATGQGGNIGINVRDARLLSESEISAIGSESSPTFEGNIEIDTNLLVLIEGSRILTDASNPTGGSNITIRPLEGSELAVLQSQDSTISAAGELSIDNTLNYDPPEAPEVTVVDPNDLIAQEFCRQRGTSQFTITGRGGLASSPNDTFTGDRTQVPLVEPVPSRPNPSTSTSTPRPRTEPNQPRTSAAPRLRSGLNIIPARGWIRDENGDVILVSYDPTKTGVRRQPVQFPQCQP